MAYNEELAEMIQAYLKMQPGYVMKKMFGGICYLIHGNMACGVLQDELIVRVGPAHYEELLLLPGVREFDVTGRVMKGWVMVSRCADGKDVELHDWIDKGVRFALTLPPK